MPSIEFHCLGIPADYGWAVCVDSVWSEEMELSCLTSSVIYLALDLIFVSLAVVRGEYNSVEDLPTEKKWISDNLTALVLHVLPTKAQWAEGCEL